ncbi:PH domain-containing protein [Luteolibacter soli]|uniref:PH domain-containing protein n=1 Tax=Luteolibacter soli TaxID=3135280 RepID=A0ABU9AR61_9BACT
MSYAGRARRSNGKEGAMYSFFRELCEKWLRIPAEPEAPPGDESSARVFRAAPKYLKYLRVMWGIRNGLAMIGALTPLTVISIALAVNHEGSASAVIAGVEVVVLGLLICQALFSLALVQLDYEKRWYLVTDRSLRIREGVATVREITFTFANIQNLSVTQGPIQRWLGIADLKVETAGGGSVVGQQQQPGLNLHTAYFRGIHNAEEVKQLISERMRVHRDAGLGDHEDRHVVPSVHEGSSTVQEVLEAMLTEAVGLRRAAEGNP